MYTLVGSHTSPYVRKLRMYLLHHQIPFQFKTINYLEANDAAFLKQNNPINKIPFLVIEGTTGASKSLFESRVIYNYLNHFHQLPLLNLTEENILSFIDATLDTAILLFSMKRAQINIEEDNAYFLRQKNRIPALLEAIHQYLVEEKLLFSPMWNFNTMSLYALLDWMRFRQVIDLEQIPWTTDFLKTYAHFKEVSLTEIIA